MSENPNEDDPEAPPAEEDAGAGGIDSGADAADPDLDLDPSEAAVDDELAADVDELIQERSPGAEASPSAAEFDEESSAATAEPATDADETIVPTQFYCRSCEYFSEPPEVHCNHEGTTIVEFVDLEHAKVRDCPIVAKRNALVEGDDMTIAQDFVEND